MMMTMLISLHSHLHHLARHHHPRVQLFLAIRQQISHHKTLAVHPSPYSIHSHTKSSHRPPVCPDTPPQPTQPNYHQSATLASTQHQRWHQHSRQSPTATPAYTQRHQWHQTNNKRRISSPQQQSPPRNLGKPTTTANTTQQSAPSPSTLSPKTTTEAVSMYHL